jgi:fumarylacetoacetase
MNISANNPNLKSWVTIPANSDFPIQNLPFGIFSEGSNDKRVGVALGEKIIDLYQLASFGYLNNTAFKPADFEQDTLNTMMLKGKEANRNLRNRISELFQQGSDELQKNEQHVAQLLFDQTACIMHIPVRIGDYTDFYSSEQHAYNVGCMFRDPDNALMPNWKHLPVGYHGRASSIVVSGTPFKRPMGQLKPSPEEDPIFAPCKLLDFELEMAFITFQGKPLGERISTEEADDYIFGMTLFNDWSARDIQKWEYIPLGPFLAKSFASHMSPWIVTLDALEPFRTAGPVQDPKVLPYLEYKGEKHVDIKIEMGIQPEGSTETTVTNSNYKHMYWNMNQQLAHHTVNGCNINCGDMMASGTISGPKEGSYGSMLEISWAGKKSVKMADGTERKFLQDNDTIIMRGYSEKDGVRVGFGEVSAKILPAS